MSLPDHAHDFFVPEEMELTCQSCGETYPLSEIIEYLFGEDSEGSDVFKES